MNISRNEEKNIKVKKRVGGNGIGFEDIEIAINKGQVLAFIENPNQQKYP